MQTLKEIKRAVVECARETYDTDDFDFAMDTRLVDERVGGDAIDAVLFIMSCEERFDRAIPEEESEKMETLGDVAEWMFKHQRGL